MFSELVSTATGLINDTFGEDVIYIHSVPNSKETIRGIFASKTIIKDDMEGEVLVKQSNLEIKLSDLNTRPKEGNYVAVRNTKYMITEVVEDEFGNAKLLLNKVGYYSAT